ncbi:uncharacterized protein LOC115735428 [Rhodamnia argentea]|uniref:Uncharacterized protein LOC115735428 n=1 Tax=Rhodamnia argentea TaxID=178133 RepID=A0A8B8NK83_9MYRT|nr:uncharacterized protein LOC115735428 [Rhodamnia argentea]
MTRQFLFHPQLANRRQPLLPNPSGEANESTAAAAKTTTTTRTRGRARLAEAAGGTAADCAALCCCCPCTVVNLLALAVYRVPAGLCRRVRRRRQRSAAAKRKKKGVLLAQRPNSFAAGSTGAADLLKAEDDGLDAGGSDSDGDDDAVGDLEKEMWDRFHGAGFWRSPSTRDT